MRLIKCVGATSSKKLRLPPWFETAETHIREQRWSNPWIFGRARRVNSQALQVFLKGSYQKIIETYFAKSEKQTILHIINLEILEPIGNSIKISQSINPPTPRKDGLTWSLGPVGYTPSAKPYVNPRDTDGPTKP